MKKDNLIGLVSNVVLKGIDDQLKNEDGFIVDQNSIDEYLTSNGGVAGAISISELNDYLVNEESGKKSGYSISCHDEIIEFVGVSNEELSSRVMRRNS